MVAETSEISGGVAREGEGGDGDKGWPRKIRIRVGGFRGREEGGRREGDRTPASASFVEKSGSALNYNIAAQGSAPSEAAGRGRRRRPRKEKKNLWEPSGEEGAANRSAGPPPGHRSTHPEPSSTTTSMPCPRSCRAAMRPAAPAPTTMTGPSAISGFAVEGNVRFPRPGAMIPLALNSDV